MRNILKFFDLQGYIAEFKVDSKDRFKTAAGGLISLLFIFVYLGLLIYYGYYAFRKATPSGYSQNLPNDDDNFFLNITDNKFLGGFQTVNDEGLPVDITPYTFVYFSLRGYIWENGNLKRKNFEIPITRCNNTNIKEIEFSRRFDDYLCPDFMSVINKGEKIYIGGDYNDDESMVLNFKVALCNEKRTICRSMKSAEKFFDENNILINSISPYVRYSINNQTNPFRLQIENKIKFINSLTAIREFFFISEYVLDDDIGLFIEDINTIKVYGKDDYHWVSSVKKPPKQNIAEKNNYFFYYCNIHFSRQRNYFFRWYEKVSDILAKVVGIMGTGYTFTTFFYYFYAKFAFERLLFNNMIMFNNEDLDSEIKRINTYNNTELKDLRNSYRNRNDIYDSNNNPPNENNNEILESEQNIVNVKNDKNNNNDESNDPKSDLNKARRLPRNSLNLPRFFSEAQNDIKERRFYNRSNVRKKILPIQKHSSKLSSDFMNKNPVLNQLNLKEKEEKIDKENNREKSLDIPNENALENGNITIIEQEKQQKLRNERLGTTKLIIDKLSEKSNNRFFSYNAFLCSFCRRKRTIKYLNLFNFYKDKINAKFDVMYYLRLDKKSYLMEKLIFSPVENDSLELLANKIYWVNTNDYIKKSKSVRGKFDLIQEYLVDSEFDKLLEHEKKIMELFQEIKRF